MAIVVQKVEAIMRVFTKRQKAQRSILPSESLLSHSEGFALGGSRVRHILRGPRLQSRRINGPKEPATRRGANDPGAIEGKGSMLPVEERAFFEPRFGRDFSQVRIHEGATANAAAQAVNARAFTMGLDIVFGDGEFGPGDPGGRRLIAHELAHVVQQNGFGLPKLTPQEAQNKTQTYGIENIANKHLRIAQLNNAPLDFILRQDLPLDDEVNAHFEDDEEILDSENDFSEPVEENEEEALPHESDDADLESADPCEAQWTQLKALLDMDESCSSMYQFLWDAYDEVAKRQDLSGEKYRGFQESAEIHDKLLELEPDLAERQEIHDDKLSLLLEEQKALEEIYNLEKEAYEQAATLLNNTHVRYWAMFQETSEAADRKKRLTDLIFEIISKDRFSPLELLKLLVALLALPQVVEKLNKLLQDLQKVTNELEQHMKAESKALEDYRFTKRTLSANRELIQSLSASEPAKEVDRLKARSVQLGRRIETLEKDIEQSYITADKLETDALNANLKCYQATEVPGVIEALKLFMMQCEGITY